MHFHVFIDILLQVFEIFIHCQNMIFRKVNFPKKLINHILKTVVHFIIKVFCTKAGLSLQTQGPRLQFCPRQASTANWGIKVVVLQGIISRYFPHPTLSLVSEQTLKYLKTSQGALAWRLGEWIWLTEPSGLHRNLPQGLNISSIRVFDQIRDSEIPITLRATKHL